MRNQSWVSSRFKVLNRFRHYVFQRRHRCHSKQLLSFLRFEIGNKRDAFRRSWFSSWDIRDRELRCQINFFWLRVLFVRFPYERQERNVQLTEILVKERTRFDDYALAPSSCRMCSAYMCLCRDSDMHPVSLTL
jgi:hypothetical protein